MKAISLWQPWATAMALGLKMNETRHWSTNVRGEIAIHAAKRPMRGGEFDYLADQFDPEVWSALPYGALLCVVRLHTIRHTEDLVDLTGQPISTGVLCAIEHLFGNYEAGRFAWQCDLIRTFETPIPWKGAQGFFDVPDHIISEAS